MSSLEDTIQMRLASFLENNPILDKQKIEPVKLKLVKCLLDGSVYSVVNSLAHLQDLKEK
jgi:hypothetical protein